VKRLGRRRWRPPGPTPSPLLWRAFRPSDGGHKAAGHGSRAEPPGGAARGRRTRHTRQPSARSSRHRKRVLTSSTRAARISSPTTTCARASALTRALTLALTRVVWPAERHQLSMHHTPASAAYAPGKAEQVQRAAGLHADPAIGDRQPCLARCHARRLRVPRARTSAAVRVAPARPPPTPGSERRLSRPPPGGAARPLPRRPPRPAARPARSSRASASTCAGAKLPSSLHSALQPGAQRVTMARTPCSALRGHRDGCRLRLPAPAADGTAALLAPRAASVTLRAMSIP